MKRWFAALFLSLLGLASTSGAGFIVVDEAHWHPPGPRPPIHPPPWPPPGPIPPRPLPPVYRFAPLEVTRLQADVRIQDQVATTTIEQEFHNPNDRRMEGTFYFPVPKGAVIRKFAMEIDGRKAEAELLAADKARGIYEDIVRRAQDPALLEYAGQDLLKLRIFPIEPRGKKRIHLTYTQLLKADTGLVGYACSLGAQKYSAAPVAQVSFKVDVQTSRPLKSVYSPTPDVEIRRQGDRRATAGYEGRQVRPESDFQLFFAAEDDAIGVNLMTYRQPGEDGYFLLLLSPGVESREVRVLPKDVVFVLDTSGSMAGSKLDQAKKALRFCVANLNDHDRFEVIRFATESEAVFNGLQEASRDHRSRAESFIQDLKPIGGTGIDDALKRALGLRPGSGDRPFVVIFLTDGLPTVGLTDEGGIVENVKQRSAGNVRVFCFGIGHDVNTHLLDRIASETRAIGQYVVPEEDIEVKVSSFYAKIKEPVLVSPALRFAGGPRITRVHPGTLPDLFQGEQVVVVGRYAGKGAAGATLEGSVDGKARRFSHDLTFPETAGDHDFIPRLWATRRIGFLLEEIRLRGDNPELREEVTELARRHGIVTPYTAYLIVEDEARRGVPLAAQSLPQLREDRDALITSQQLGANLTRERTGGGAVASARTSLALQSADSPAAAVAQAATEAKRGLAAAPVAPPTAAPVPGRVGAPIPTAPATGRAQDAASRLAQYAQQTRVAGGRTFYQNGNQWIEASVQKLPQARRQQVRFNSTEYFDLLRRHPEAQAWLALGPNVQFVLGDAVYEVQE